MRRSIRLTLAGLILALIAGPVGVRAAPAEAVDLVLEWRPGLPVLTVNAEGAMVVELPGYETGGEPGAPALPWRGELLALPPGASPEIEILSLTETWLPLPGPLERVPAVVGAMRGADGQPMGLAYAPAEERPAPEQPVILKEIGLARGVRLARLEFHPLLPQSGGLRAITYLRAAIHFHAPAAAAAGGAADPMLDALRQAVLNPLSVSSQKEGDVEGAGGAVGAQHAAPLRPLRPLSLSPLFLRGYNTPLAWIDVITPGLTALTRMDLAAAGFPVAGADPHALRLARGGSEVTMEWEGDEDAIFEDGERLLFYAAPRFSRWTARDAYQLSLGAAPVARMAVRSATPGAPAGTAWVEQVFEDNSLYTPHCLCGRLPAGRDGDRWTWDQLNLPDRSSRRYVAALPAVDSSRPAQLTLWLIGYTDRLNVSPDHRVQASLNGTFAGQVDWDGRQAVTLTLALPAGVLKTGDNTLDLSLPGLGSVVEGAWLDAFALRYAAGSGAGLAATFDGEAQARSYTLSLSGGSGLRAYDITQPDQPQRLSEVAVNGASLMLGDIPGQGGRRYHVTTAEAIQSPAAVRLPAALSGAAGADYLVIAPSGLISALAPLLALRQSQGLSTAVESMQAVYDAYGGGRPEPEAIRLLLADVYARWSPRPTYVLLVGDGTFDPRGYRANSAPSLIPPYLADVDPGMGETAADNRYADVTGDALPEFLLGRLPVNSLAEAQAVIDKIVRYETLPAPGGWNGKVTLVTDNPDEAGDFHAEASALAGLVPAPFTVERFFLDASAADTVTATRQGALQTLQFGAGLAAYMGHASPRQWAGERLFHRDDVAGLANLGRLPVLLELTCLTGSFHEAGDNTLDEVLVRQPGGGAAAVWGPSGLGVATGHKRLAEGFLRAVYQDGRAGLGQATFQGRLSLAAAGRDQDLLDTFNLLGDPAMSLNLKIVPWPNHLLLPLVYRSTP